MELLSCIQSWSAGATANLSQMANTLRGSDVGQALPAQNGVQASAGASLSSMVSSISQSFTQLTQSSGSSASTDQLLRTLITAMVILALLEQAQGASESQGGATANLLGLGGRSETMQSDMTSSFTFISVEQSVASYSSVTDFAQFNFSSSTASGGQLDVSA